MKFRIRQKKITFKQTVGLRNIKIIKSNQRLKLYNMKHKLEN